MSEIKDVEKPFIEPTQENVNNETDIKKNKSLFEYLIKNIPYIDDEESIDKDTKLVEENIDKIEQTDGKDKEDSNETNLQQCDDDENNSKRKFLLFVFKETALLIITAILSLSDAYSDLYLGYVYCKDGQYAFGVLTYIFVILATFINTAYLYEQNFSFKEDNFMYKIVNTLWLLFFIFIFQIPVVIIVFNNFVYKIKYRKYKRKEYQEVVAKNDAHLKLQKLFECAFEAVPQLILQVSLLLKIYHIEDGETNQDFTVLEYAKTFSVVTSFFVMAWAFMPDFQLADKNRKEKIDVIINLMFSFTWHVVTISSRILTICIFLCCYPLYAGLGILLHWIISLFIYHRMGIVEGTSTTFGYYVQLSIFTVGYTFIAWVHFNVEKFLIHIIYFILVSSENIFGAVFWLYMMRNASVGYFVYYLIPVICIFPVVLAVFFETLIYIKITSKDKNKPVEA